MQHASLLQQYLEMARPYLHNYGYAALFFGVFIEGFGIPAPGQTLIIAAALLAAQHQLNITVVLLLAWSAAVAGDNLGYTIGRFAGRRLVLHHGGRIGLRAEHLERVERFFNHYGSIVVAFARFVEVLRQLNGVVAGTSGMHWLRFPLFNAVGAALWVGLWGYGVYRLGEHLNLVLNLFKRFEPFLLGVGLVLVVLFVIYLFRRK